MKKAEGEKRSLAEKELQQGKERWRSMREGSQRRNERRERTENGGGQYGKCSG